MTFLKEYALQFIGLPYMWGGDDPMAGFDCSGLVIELLIAAGRLPPKWDGSAQSLYRFFNEKFPAVSQVQNYVFKNTWPQIGFLSFYGKDYSNIDHVGMMLDEFTMIEAGSGNSLTTSLDQTIKQNAFIRLRPYNYRHDHLIFVRTI